MGQDTLGKGRPFMRATRSRTCCAEAVLPTETRKKGDSGSKGKRRVRRKRGTEDSPSNQRQPRGYSTSQASPASATVPTVQKPCMMHRQHVRQRPSDVRLPLPTMIVGEHCVFYSKHPSGHLGNDMCRFEPPLQKPCMMYCTHVSKHVTDYACHAKPTVQKPCRMHRASST